MIMAVSKIPQLFRRKVATPITVTAKAPINPHSPGPTTANPATEAQGHPHAHSFMDLPAGYRMEMNAQHPGSFKLYNVRTGHGMFVPTKNRPFFWQMALDMINEQQGGIIQRMATEYNRSYITGAGKVVQVRMHPVGVNAYKNALLQMHPTKGLAIDSSAPNGTIAYNLEFFGLPVVGDPKLSPTQIVMSREKS